MGVAELRFGVLLATCFALPLVAFVLLRPNAYHDWRHFYFLHGPFCLLATFALMGLRQLSARGLRKEWVGGAACALTAAGLGAAALEMAQIHPNQHLFFNFLEDRKTPERLQSRYTADFYAMAMRQGYERLLKQTQSAAINIEGKYFKTDILRHLSWNELILPAADWRRFTYDPSRDPEFYLDIRGNAIRSNLPEDPFPPILHRTKVYNNTIMTVSTPDLSRVAPAVAEAYRALHRAATAGEPVARAGGYEVHRHGLWLAWVKEACEPGALARPFRLRLYPANARHLPDHLRKQGYFEFSVHGVRFDGKCLGAARLPDFALARIRLKQPEKWVEVPL